MIDVNALRGKIAEQGTSQVKVADYIGITPKTFYIKMSKGIFGSDEIDKMIDYLHIENPVEIFFAEKVT